MSGPHRLSRLAFLLYGLWIRYAGVLQVLVAVAYKIVLELGLNFHCFVAIYFINHFAFLMIASPINSRPMVRILEFYLLTYLEV